MDIVAIVSGGMDSVTLACLLRSQNPNADMHLLSFDYGQRHRKELEYAEMCAEDIGAQWDIIDLSHLRSLLAQSHSALVDPDVEVPHGHYEHESMRWTVVPNRNAIMLSIATGIAVASDAEIVATGVHAGDHAIYPDCRPQFIADMQNAMFVGNEGFCKPEFQIIAPFITCTKTDIARKGKVLGVDYTKTWSCYEGKDVHCGKCGTCVERHEALEEALGTDPTIYA